ncbi:MAG: hypothetical protein OXE84_14640 [Rhodobacteraceae bacterium]|nr:hypothetical protein [Paracoccaceae bacterium]MCY4196689.1 hypothetical protein [Paracoccaceae bacterium]MCY4325997.1 hypothetical protein [Paracoccaceae bacterium]
MATANKGGRPATYQDILDAPHHMVAEILDGILYTQRRSPDSQSNSATPLTVVDPVAGGSSVNRNSIWARTSWSPI